MELTMESKKKEAKRFRRWLANEVIPSLIHNGVYIMEDANKRNKARVKSKVNRYGMTIQFIKDERGYWFLKNITDLYYNYRYGMSAQKLREKYGFDEKFTIKDALNKSELKFITACDGYINYLHSLDKEDEEIYDELLEMLEDKFEKDVDFFYCLNNIYQPLVLKYLSGEIDIIHKIEEVMVK